MHTYKKFIQALSLCGLVLLSSCSLPAREGRGDFFVSVQNGKFYQGEQEYRFVGTNFWYGAILASEGRGGNRERLTKELDLMQSVGIDNIRVLVGGDGDGEMDYQIKPTLQTRAGIYNDTILAGLDYLMAELERRDMKAVLYLNNAWEWSGGFGKYLEWAGEGPAVTPRDWSAFQKYHSEFSKNQKAMELAANHTRFIVSRTNTITGKPYSESTALMAWELANEPRCFASDAKTKECFVQWIEAQAKLIKSIDPNHLVTTGSEGKNGCEGDIELFERIHAIPEIDYACIHIWPFNWAWLGTYVATIGEAIEVNGPESVVNSVERACKNTEEYIEEAYAKMHPLGKPIVLEEFGYPRDNYAIEAGSPTTGRDAYFSHVFNIIRESGKIAGCNFWSWGGLADVKHGNWQMWDDYTGDPAQEEQGLNSVFASDSSTMKMIKEVSLAPICCTLVANDSDWVWYGDEAFKVELQVSNLTNKIQDIDSISLKVFSDRGDLVHAWTKYAADIKFPETLSWAGDHFPLEPGFYHIKVEVNGQNVVHNITEVYGNQMPIDFFCIGYEPEKIISEPDPQPDFKQFWDDARAELANTQINAQVIELKDQKGEKRAFNAIIQGLDGAPVQVYYTLPKQKEKGKIFPVHIINMGYSSKPWPLDLTDNGWIDVIVSSRGQGSNDDKNPYGKWIQYGLENPQKYYYRGAYLDCPRAIDYLCTLPEVDQNNIFLEGGSQGGAYSMACAALDHRVRAVACYITFMSDFPDYFKIAAWPGNEIIGRQQELGISDEELYRNLSYFDIKNLAPWIECPVYMAVGLQDITCPTHTNFAGYNQVKTEKQYHIYRNYGHHVDYSHWTPTMYEWYNKHKK